MAAGRRSDGHAVKQLQHQVAAGQRRALARARRAQAVRSYFNQQGVTTPIVAAVGFGETRPVATNGTAAGRQPNRRVEIIVSGESIGRTN